MKFGSVVVNVRVVLSLALSVCAACKASNAEIDFPEAGGRAEAGQKSDAGRGGEGGGDAGSDAGEGGEGGEAGEGGEGGNGNPGGSGGEGGNDGHAGAGAGGSGGAGAGGMGGAGGGGAGGMGGAGGGGAGGEGGEGGAGGEGGGGGGGGGCPTDYTMATHIVMDVSWEGSAVVKGGTGKVHVWTRSSFSGSLDASAIDSQSCGTILPSIETEAIAGGDLILPEIPMDAWDSESMPVFSGVGVKEGTAWSSDSGATLIGLTMDNPNGAWPEAVDIDQVDHDGDGKPGITAVPRVGGDYAAPPVEFKFPVSGAKRADRLYLANRNAMTLSATVDGCPESHTGVANVTKFDNHVIGCHVKDGDDCTPTQAAFVDDNRTIFEVQSAVFEAKRVAEDADCADIRAALPAD
jgi:hypothetical protein